MLRAARLGAGGFESVTPRMMELPRYEADGAPAGVKLAAEDGGGGPAGVVDGLLANMSNERPCELRSGVDGAELSLGTSKRDDMFGKLERALRWCVSVVEMSSRRSEAPEELCGGGMEDIQ